MTARRGGAGMIVACVPVPPAVRFPEMIIGIIRVLPIPPCGCRCATHECRIGLRHGPGEGRRPPRGVAASPRDRTPRPRAPPPRVGRRVRRAVPVGPGGRPGNAATGDPYRSVAGLAPIRRIRGLSPFVIRDSSPIANMNRRRFNHGSLRNHFYTEIT